MSLVSVIALTLFSVAGVVGAADIANIIVKRMKITVSMLPRVVGDLAWLFVVLMLVVMFATQDYRTYPPLIASAAWLGIGSWALYAIDRLLSRRYRVETKEKSEVGL